MYKKPRICKTLSIFYNVLVNNANIDDLNSDTSSLRFSMKSLDITYATLTGHINEIVNISFQPVTYVTYLKLIAITVMLRISARALI